MVYMPCPKAAKKWCISEKRAQKLCEDNRIPGIPKIGYMWLIPKDAEKPTDKRMNKEEKTLTFTDATIIARSSCGNVIGSL